LSRGFRLQPAVDSRAALAASTTGSRTGGSNVMPLSSFAAAICRFSSFWVS